MSPQLLCRRLLLYKCGGFTLLIAISWLNELNALPFLFLGGSALPNWRAAVLETVVILGAAFPTIWLTQRLARRLIYLERLVHICSWCRNVHANGERLPIEQFFPVKLKTDLSHGICPACSEKFAAGIPAVKA